MARDLDLDEIYRAHCGAVRAFVHRRLPADSADDVVSEVFVSAWRRRGDRPDDVRLWLFGIARGLIANRRRSETRLQALRSRLAENVDLSHDPGPEETATETGTVVRAFDSLSARDQEVLSLVAWEGLRPSEIAEVLGIAPSLVSLRLHRARRRLANAFAERERCAHNPVAPSSVEAMR